MKFRNQIEKLLSFTRSTHPRTSSSFAPFSPAPAAAAETEAPLLVNEIEVKTYLKNEIAQLLYRPYIDEEITANLEFINSNKRKDRIVSIWKTIIQETAENT